MPLNLPRVITPHTNTYAYISEITLIVPGLYLSSLAAARVPDALNTIGITHIITILDFPVTFEGWTGTRLVLKLSDGVETDILSRFDECVEFIEKGINGGGKVLVHCMQGLSRSVIVITAYLVVGHGMGADEALKFVREKRGNVQPNDGFVRQLKLYEGRGKGKGRGSIWSKLVGWRIK